MTPRLPRRARAVEGSPRPPRAPRTPPWRGAAGGGGAEGRRVSGRWWGCGGGGAVPRAGSGGPEPVAPGGGSGEDRMPGTRGCRGVWRGPQQASRARRGGGGRGTAGGTLGRPGARVGVWSTRAGRARRDGAAAGTSPSSAGPAVGGPLHRFLFFVPRARAASAGGLLRRSRLCPQGRHGRPDRRQALGRIRDHVLPATDVRVRRACVRTGSQFHCP